MTKITTLFLLLLSTNLACAEVMDKEPPILVAWCSAIPSAVLACLLARLHPLLGLVAVVPLLPALGILSECHDQFVGPGIFHEAGPNYVIQAHMAPAVVLVAYAAGGLLWWSARNKKSISINSNPGLNREAP